MAGWTHLTRKYKMLRGLVSRDNKTSVNDSRKIEADLSSQNTSSLGFTRLDLSDNQSHQLEA